MATENEGFDPRHVEAWVAFWNTYDLTEVDTLFVTDARVSYFSSETHGVIKGLDALRKHHAGFGFVPGGKVQRNRLWLEEIGTDVFGPTAVVTAVWCFQKADSDRVQKGPVTLVYVRAGDGHRIAHAHFANYA